MTYDFETGQNLYILQAERDLETYAITNAASCGPLATNIPISTRFNLMEDSYTKLAEIPQNMMCTKTFSWPRLQHGYMGGFQSQ
jgi:hypothetical protein